MRIKKEIAIFLLFFLLGIFSRALFASKDFTHMDAVLYAIGSFDFSIKDGMPPSPGYFIYIMTARLLNVFTHNPYNSLIFISVFYSGLIAGTLYYFGALLKGQVVGIVSAILFLTSPLFWYKGITVFGYLNSGFFVLLAALFTYLIVTGKGKFGFWLSVSLGILIGVRQQELIVMLPLFVYALLHMKPRQAIYSLVTFFVVCILWFIPLVLMSGGLKEYLSVLKTGSVYLAEDSVFSSNFISKLNNHVVRMVQYFERAYFLGIIPLIYYAGRFFYLPSFVDNKKTQFFAVWLAPCLLYNIFIQFGEVGHGMSWALGLVLILAEAVVVLSEDMLTMVAMCVKRTSKKITEIRHQQLWKNVTFTMVLSPIIATNFFMFFYDFDKDEKMPFYDFGKYTQSNYNYVLKINHFVKAKTNFIRNKLNPQRSIIIASSAFIHQVMYHFPDSTVIHSSILDKKNKTSFWYCHGYKRTYYKDKTSFTIPDGYTKVVVFDDKLIPYVQGGNNIVYYDVDDIYRLAEIDVKAGQKIDFDFHSIRIN